MRSVREIGFQWRRRWNWDGNGFRGGGDFFGLLPGVHDSMDYGDIGADGENPEDRRHAICESADDHQHKALGAVPEADVFVGHERFRAGFRVTHHNGTCHGCAGEKGVDETVDAGVVEVVLVLVAQPDVGAVPAGIVIVAICSRLSRRSVARA